jgi:YHS domain-containing protein
VPADAQRRAVARHPAPPTHPTHPPPAVEVSGHVFIGRFFYDPFFGPNPWWPRQTFPYWYVPIDDTRAALRLRAAPDQAAVYVDGFYAGIINDFDGFFEGLPLRPGGHRIVSYLEGRRTVCGMSVSPEEPAPEAGFVGTTYRFCSVLCREQFLRSPGHDISGSDSA